LFTLKSIFTYYSSKIEQEILADAARILGAIGCSLDCLGEWYFGEIKILVIIEGTCQISMIVIIGYIDKYYKR